MNDTRNCLICRSPSSAQHPATPYWICPCCDLWFQHPLPPKLLHGPHEGPPQAMPAAEKVANAQLAQWLFSRLLEGKGGPGGGVVLDVGSAYPYLAHCLHNLGFTAVAMDPADEAADWARELNVYPITGDFETFEFGAMHASLLGGPFRLISFVHSWEHLYDPLAALRKLRRLVADDGAVFIRMPDHRVPGYERDLTDGHFAIHPFYHSLTSVLQACAETATFVVAEQIALTPGQRDLILRPL